MAQSGAAVEIRYSSFIEFDDDGPLIVWVALSGAPGVDHIIAGGILRPDELGILP